MTSTRRSLRLTKASSWSTTLTPSPTSPSFSNTLLEKEPSTPSLVTSSQLTRWMILLFIYTSLRGPCHTTQEDILKCNLTNFLLYFITNVSDFFEQ